MAVGASGCGRPRVLLPVGLVPGRGSVSVITLRKVRTETIVMELKWKL